MITSVTTAIGFLTLNFSEVPILRDLGNLTALGVMLACVFSLTLLPIMMSVLPLKAAKVRQGSAMLDRLAELVIRRQRPVLWGFVLLTLLCSALLSLNKINDEPNK
ncbi:MMPL family transporter, partial [Arthrospira platensis SPKY1]|nr:MMPL family transporter [Arthrospira platensis SPKY1]